MNQISPSWSAENEQHFLFLNQTVKQFIIGLVAIQAIFQIICVLYNFLFSMFLNQYSATFINPLNLNSFAADMWLILFLVIFASGFYIKNKKIVKVPNYLTLAYPIFIIILSLFRSVPSLIAVVFISVCSIIILKVNFNLMIKKQVEKVK